MAMSPLRAIVTGVLFLDRISEERDVVERGQLVTIVEYRDGGRCVFVADSGRMGRCHSSSFRILTPIQVPNAKATKKKKAKKGSLTMER